jgi:hypothetical protein
MMSEASAFWFDRVEKAVQDLCKALEEHRRALMAQAALRTELRVALFKEQVSNDPAATPVFERAMAA